MHVNHRVHEGDQEGEKGNADNREDQRSRRQQPPNVADERLINVARKGREELGRRNRADEQAGNSADQGESGEDGLITVFMTQKHRRQHSTGHRAQDDRQKRK